MSRILKGESSRAPSPGESAGRDRIVPGPLRDAQERAREILADAERQAEAIRAAAIAEADEVRRRAEAAGWEAGQARAAEIIARAAAERDAALASAERDVVELALGVAAKILGREVERGAAVDIVAQALSAVRRARRVRVRISPLDAESVRAREPELAARLAQGAGLDLCEDPSIARGGCLVETENGVVDARLETQLEALRRALLGGG